MSEYWFDDSAADKACRFFEYLPHIKGRKARQPFRLEEWQREEIIRPLFGWKREDGTRKYRTAYIEIPRKNGKSSLSAVIALYLLFCDGEEGAEVYSVAGTRDQALMVFDPACAMINSTELADACQVYKSQKRVVYKNSFYRAIAADAGPVHGTNPHGIIFDEVHVQKSRDLWDTLQSGRGERRQPLTIAITTAGYDRSTICWELHQYAKRVLDPNDDFDDPTFLPVIYGAEPDEPWDDPATWRKANPNLGVSVFEDSLREECQKAKESPAYENTFRRLHLNQWTEQAVRWMPMEAWDACGEPFDVEGLISRECYGGLDIASTRDLASFALVFPMDEETYRVLVWFWCPKDAATKRDRQDRQSYRGWVPKWIKTTDGNSIEQSVIRKHLWECSEKYDIRSIAFDPWNMDECYQQLVREGWPEDTLLAFRQGHASYNEPMQKVLSLVRDGKLLHGGNPVLRWNASNVVVKLDSNGNVKPDKGASSEKIDGFCAMTMALAMAIHKKEVDETSIYETPGNLVL